MKFMKYIQGAILLFFILLFLALYIISRFVLYAYNSIMYIVTKNGSYKVRKLRIQIRFKEMFL